MTQEETLVVAAGSEPYFVHPSSIVEQGATIGAGTKLWHFCHVFSGAKIGENCVVGQGCSIAAEAVLGNGVKLQNGVSVYDGVILEDDVFCGPHMVFTNVVNPRAFIAEGRVSPHPDLPRGHAGGRGRDCLRAHRGDVCDGRRGSGGDPRRAAICTGFRQSRTATRLGRPSGQPAGLRRRRSGWTGREPLRAGQRPGPH